MRLEELEFDAWGRDMAVTFESQCKTKFIARCRRMGAYARRVEDQYSVGVLDMVVAFSGLPVAFLEGKMVEHRLFQPTPRQFIEGNRIIALEGGHSIPLLVAWDKFGGFFIHPWARTALTQNSFRGEGNTDDATTLKHYLEALQSGAIPKPRPSSGVLRTFRHSR